MIAKIAVSAANYAIDKPYSYLIPQGMELEPGIRVMVPFGRGNRPSEGIVLSVEPGIEDGFKAVSSRLDDSPMLSEHLLRLAAFLRERYFCTFFDAIRAILPAGMWFRSKERCTLTEEGRAAHAERKPSAQAVLVLLRDLGGEADEAALRAAVPDADELADAVKYLQRKKWITTQTDFLRRTGEKTEQIASLAVPAEEAMEFASRRPKSAAAQRAVLELLCTVGQASVKELCYFTGAKAPTVKRLADLGYVELSDRAVLRCREIKPAVLDGPLVLNEEQQSCFNGISARMGEEKPGVALLYGVTGSGKTSVYLKLIRKCLDEGKSAMLLVPEIGLTAQLLSLLSAHFGEQVAVLHSSLPAGERYDQWRRIRSGDARVIVGTRSAVFAPSENLGILILDEEQEHSYKSENSPRYSAREVAIWRGVKERALVLLGSATPSVETMYMAKSGAYSLFTLKRRYNGRPLPKVEIVDLREEVKQGNDGSVSYFLQDAIRDTMAQGKQTVLFLNRRGNSRALVCVNCGEAPECPRCSARLTYHSANERLMCHYCGHSEPVPHRCPHCGGPVKRVGTGTQKVQQELLAVFPDAQIDRMDADTVSAVNTHEKILEHFQSNRVPVLIGTQMVAKGLNLPDVTLVGVLDADLGLYADSFRAAETTFNMLTQVVGRAGRGDTAGRAVIQTMVPEHQVLKLASRQDYDSFYELEIGLRRMQGYPPFGDLAWVTFTGEAEGAVLRGAAKFRDSLISCMRAPAYQGEQCTVLGPAPCPVPKINYNFRYRLSLRCRMTKNLRLLLAYLLRQFAQDKANRGISAFADVNGFE